MVVSKVMLVGILMLAADDGSFIRDITVAEVLDTQKQCEDRKTHVANNLKSWQEAGVVGATDIQCLPLKLDTKLPEKMDAPAPKKTPELEPKPKVRFN